MDTYRNQELGSNLHWRNSTEMGRYDAMFGDCQVSVIKLH